MLKNIVKLAALAVFALSFSSGASAQYYVPIDKAKEQTSEKPAPSSTPDAPRPVSNAPLAAAVAQPCSENDIKFIDRVEKGRESARRALPNLSREDRDFVEFIQDPVNIQTMAVTYARCREQVKKQGESAAAAPAGKKP